MRNSPIAANLIDASLIKACLSAAFVTVLCIAPAFAATDPMASFYGNTIVSSGGSVQIRTHYNADHSFNLTGSMMLMHRNFNGTWALDGKGNLCRTYIGSVPPKTPIPDCTPFVPRKIGESWKGRDDTYTFTVKAGIL
jgi:hypothetical protein